MVAMVVAMVVVVVCGTVRARIPFQLELRPDGAGRYVTITRQTDVVVEYVLSDVLEI